MTSRTCDLFKWCLSNGYHLRENPIRPNERRTNPSHYLMDGTLGGVLFIPDAENLTFLRMYAQELVSGNRLYISEQRTPIFKYHFDLDIKRKEYAPLSATIDLHGTSSASSSMRTQHHRTSHTDMCDQDDCKGCDDNVATRSVHGSETGSLFHVSIGDEENTPVFLRDLDPVSIDHMILEYCRVVLDVVKRFFPANTDPNTFTLVICRRENVLLSEEPRTLGLGVHGVMPFLYVTDKMALVMRGAIIARLKETYGGLDHVQNSWEDVFDEQVYTKNGLRMLGSRKMVKCRDCKQDKVRMQICTTCMGAGRIDQGRVYKPWKVLRYDGANEDVPFLQRLQRSFDVQVDCTSVRVFGKPTTANWAAYDGCPITPALDKELSAEVIIDGRPVRLFKEDASVLSKIRNKIFLPRDAQRWKIIEVFLRSINPKYGRIMIENIFTNNKGEWYIINVGGDGSSYCMNLGRDHRSNKIYFIVRKEGVYQKCYCRCNTTQGRRYGLCRNYTSARQLITDELKCVFFRVTTDHTHMSSSSSSSSNGMNMGGSDPTDDSVEPSMLPPKTVRAPSEGISVALSTRNNTHARTNVHVHAKAVNRAITYLRSWLREAYDHRQHGRSHGAFGKAAGATSVTTSQSSRKVGGGPNKRKPEQQLEPRLPPQQLSVGKSKKPVIEVDPNSDLDVEPNPIPNPVQKAKRTRVSKPREKRSAPAPQAEHSTNAVHLSSDDDV